ncbi:hypothetical protein D3C85_1200860 [compost metagenome]
MVDRVGTQRRLFQYQCIAALLIWQAETPGAGIRQVDVPRLGLRQVPTLLSRVMGVLPPGLVILVTEGRCIVDGFAAGVVHSDPMDDAAIFIPLKVEAVLT